MSVRVGCSGWEYEEWRGGFYPSSLPKRLWFDHYTRAFDFVEVNGTFYRLPEASTFAVWAERAPPGFLYGVKASRFLTHMKKLNEPEEPLARLFGRMVPLGEHEGPVLYQLPPGWALNRERLVRFLQALPREKRHVIEFRETSWYADEVLETLARHGVALCVHDLPGNPSPRLQVGPFVYVRFHGTTAPYAGAYGKRRLARWAEWFDHHRARGLDVYAAFNNDIGGHAPRDAAILKALLG